MICTHLTTPDTAPSYGRWNHFRSRHCKSLHVCMHKNLEQSWDQPAVAEIKINPLVQIIYGKRRVFTYAIWHEISTDLHQKVNTINNIISFLQYGIYRHGLIPHTDLRSTPTYEHSKICHKNDDSWLPF